MPIFHASFLCASVFCFLVSKKSNCCYYFFLRNCLRIVYLLLLLIIVSIIRESNIQIVCATQRQTRSTACIWRNITTTTFFLFLFLNLYYRQYFDMNVSLLVCLHLSASYHEEIMTILKSCQHHQSDLAFQVYIQFFNHLDNICFFLHSQVWQEKTDDTVRKEKD